MKVLIPTPLLSYTKEREVEASGATLMELLADLDRQYPGLRFRVIDEQERMRPHMRFFVNNAQVFDLTHPLRPTDSVILVQALSGERQFSEFIHNLLDSASQNLGICLHPQGLIWHGRGTSAPQISQTIVGT
jgi:molybdopterin converting factor small subunit